ncbi:copper amine oxidase N-terminal domain-containing protein [Dehalobacterium formicoaceticum]|uniref:copper amine oxidase N-terminal domain-containing protein n=1 Tax=Dehalobacterium formicoaceticum TaxID=51515 RepID=UPI0031F69395
MKKFGFAGLVIFLWCSVLGGGVLATGSIPASISLTVNDRLAYLGQRPVMLDVPALVEQGVTLVPMRFVGEALGSTVHWSPENRRITMKQGVSQVILEVGKTTAQVDGEDQGLIVPPKIKDGRTLVPLRFIAQAFGCQVDYENQTKKITISRPNNPPQSNFTVNKTVADVGEEIVYQDLSTDPDGDAIVDRLWMNQKQYFYDPGIYVVSLKVKDSRGTWSEWFEQTIEIIGEPNTKPVALFSTDRTKVYVDEPILYTDESFDPDGDEIVEWNWQNKKDSFAIPGTYYVSLEVKDRRGGWSSKYLQVIEVLEKPNVPPVAKFSLQSTTIDQGVTIAFTDESFDPDGDGVTEVQWTGKQRAYFKAGKVPVTLKVKDGRGKWSEPFTVELNVTDKVVMTELEYNLHYPLSGEIVNLNGINPLNFPVVKPVAKSFDDTVLIISNSPETVKESGILYQDTVCGSVRLIYSHKNVSSGKKKVYILAENPGMKNTVITVNKKGTGGPSTDDLAIGKNGVARFLSSNLKDSYTLAPGQVIVLDGSGAGGILATNQSIYAMMDLTTTENVKFTFVMVDAGSDVLTTCAGLPILERDVHQRGTFFGANRTYQLDVTGDQPVRFSLADSNSDYHLGGMDAITGQQVINKGNYGLMYKLVINAGSRMGLLTNPRGGLFMGAGMLPDGSVYGLPNTGFVSNGTQAVMNLVMNQYDQSEFLFTPPVSSYMPVMFLFVPY